MKEIWKNIFGYEGLYQVSNYGRVKSLNYKQTRKEQLLKQGIDSRGRLKVILCKNKNKKTILVHRLVAQSFLDNPNNLPCINHKDENPLNNNIENLEYCSFLYNDNYGTRNKRIAKRLSKQVGQYSLDGNFIRSFQSTQEIQRELGFNQGHISKCCNGKQKTAYGFIWKYT